MNLNTFLTVQNTQRLCHCLVLTHESQTVLIQSFRNEELRLEIKSQNKYIEDEQRSDSHVMQERHCY